MPHGIDPVDAAYAREAEERQARIEDAGVNQTTEVTLRFEVTDVRKFSRWIDEHIGSQQSAVHGCVAYWDDDFALPDPGDEDEDDEG